MGCILSSATYIYIYIPLPAIPVSKFSPQPSKVPKGGDDAVEATWEGMGSAVANKQDWAVHCKTFTQAQGSPGRTAQVCCTSASLPLPLLLPSPTLTCGADSISLHAGSL